jgi:uncharacterized protein
MTAAPAPPDSRYAPLILPEEGRLADNIAHFARALRKAGLRLGPGRVLDAVRAVAAVGFTRRDDFHHTLAAVLVSRPEDRVVFDQVFRLFWRDPRYLEQMMSLLIPQVRGVQEDRPADAAERRAAEALLDGAAHPPAARDPSDDSGGEEVEIDAVATASAEERLRSLDFELMSTAEAEAAKRMIARLRLPVPPLATRRLRPVPAAAAGARLDPGRTLRRAFSTGGEVLRLAERAPRMAWPNLVVLCDISGSMASYSRMILHFVHAVANREGQGWARVHAFTFGTRLTNITRQMRGRDADQALAAAGAAAQDWSGGTRIGHALHAFNRDWARRVLGRGAVVLLISDGLDRDGAAAVGPEMARLSMRAGRLIWINPLLRWDGFRPRAEGIRAMLPYCDAVRAGHSVRTLEDLGALLADPRDAGDRGRLLADVRDASFSR